MHELPPLPAHVGVLTDEDETRLAETYSLPSGYAHCPTCRGHKVFRFYDQMSVLPEQRKIVEYECPCYDQMVLHRYFLNHGLRELYARYWWGDAPGLDLAIHTTVRDYHVKIDRYLGAGLGLYLHGSHGNGKTLVAALLLKTALRRGVDGYWATLTDLLNLYQETWRNPEYRRWFERRVVNAELLVVDDMGREFDGRTTAASSVDAIFRARVQGGRTTFVTTNLDEAEFNERYTRGVTSMVEESCQRLYVGGGDWRVQAKRRNLAEVDAEITRPFTFGGA